MNEEKINILKYAVLLNIIDIGEFFDIIESKVDIKFYDYILNKFYDLYFANRNINEIVYLINQKCTPNTYDFYRIFFLHFYTQNSIHTDIDINKFAKRVLNLYKTIPEEIQESEIEFISLLMNCMELNDLNLAFPMKLPDELNEFVKAKLNNFDPSPFTNLMLQLTTLSHGLCLHKPS